MYYNHYLILTTASKLPIYVPLIHGKRYVQKFGLGLIVPFSVLLFLLCEFNFIELLLS